jgi:SAM-dependent methyltransferase
VTRQTSTPDFWDARYEGAALTFGAAPTPLVVAEAGRFAAGARVVDLGAGEGRNALFLARRGCRVVALDFAETGLAKARAWAARDGLALETERADLARWTPPPGAFDGAVCVFVHLLPDERAGLYRAIRAALRPGGVLVAEWFTPAQLGHASGGPSQPDRLVAPAELRAAFARFGTVHRCEEAERVLDEGPYLQGPAATVQFVYENGAGAPGAGVRHGF